MEARYLVCYDMRFLLLSIPFFLAAGELGDFAPLVNAFGIAAVLAFVLTKLEPRLRNIETAIDRMSRALLLVVVSKDGPSTAEREQAQIILDELGEKGDK